MSITAVFTTTCDGCGDHVQYTNTVTLDADNARSLSWAEGWPDNWVQWAQTPVPDPDQPGEMLWREPLFFHSNACLKGWLIRTGQADVAAEMDDWIAIA